MFPLRPLLLTLCGLALSLAAWRLVTELAASLDAFRRWSRRPAEIWGFPSDRTATVMLDRDNHLTTTVPLTPLSFYSSYQPVTLLTHPTDPHSRRLLHPFDLAFAPLVWLLALVLAAWSLNFVWRLPLGADYVWTTAGWAPPPQPLPTLLPSFLEVHQPRESIQATLGFSLLLGLPLFAGGLWAFRTNILTGVLLTFGASFLLGFLLVAFGESLTQTISANQQYVESRSIFGRRRLAWSDVATVELDDVGQRLRQLDRELSRGGSSHKSRLLPFRPDIQLWRFKDVTGREMLSIDVECVPARGLTALIEHARRR